MLREAWALAIETLSWMEMQRLNERLALAKTIKQLRIADPDALRLARLLIYETIRRKNFIDKFINHCIKPHTIDEYDLGVQAFLRLYVYQTRASNNWTRIDIDEATDIANQARTILGWESLQQIEPALGIFLTGDPSVVFERARDEEKVGFETFHPTWFVEYCFRLFGRTQAMLILETTTKAPPTYIRVNTLKTDEDTFLENIAKEDIHLEKVEELDYVYRIKKSKIPVIMSASFRQGLFYIEDKASCFAAEVAEPQPNTKTLDVCAAPGAKTTHLAQLMQNLGAIYSVDYSKRRMKLWKSEVVRMGVKIAEPIIADASNALPLNLDTDLVVIDAPSTGTGTFAKSPSAKWRVTPRSIYRMAEVQWRILNNCAENVKPGGKLVYSTYTFTVEENEMLIERLLKWRPEFHLEDVKPNLGLPGLRGLDKCRRLYPHLHWCNGLFIAKLHKDGH